MHRVVSVTFRYIFFCLILSLEHFMCSSVAIAQSPPAEAIGILRGLENNRTSAEPFRVRAIVKRVIAGPVWNCEILVEFADGRYRISAAEPVNSVFIFDGSQVLCYDGKSSAVITTPDRRTAYGIAFDPRSIGFSTGLYSDLTLEENIAYHSGNKITITRREETAPLRDLVTIELTDRFLQRIRFDVEPKSPFRVHHYAKTIPSVDGEGIFARYLADSYYWPDDAEEWIPKKVVMYTQDIRDSTKKIDETIIEFDKPERRVSFNSDLWTAKGLALPFGQPLADLRIGQRVGYWNGDQIVKEVPIKGMEPIADPQKNSIGWLVLVNVLAIAILSALLLWRRFSLQNKQG